MYLKNIHIQNFQKHSDLQIDFVNGVNILHGDSETGKSCIKHAIEFLCQHDSFKGQRKIGTKKTSVKGEFSNGITVERIISASINRYILNQPGKKEQEFNSVGKSAPDEIKEAIGIFPITVDGEEIFLNSSSQIALPFLFDKSPSFRMKLFNKLTGNDVLDKLFGQFNKDILRIKRGYKEEVERFENRAIELKEKKKEKEKAETTHSRLKKRVENIKKLYEKYSKLLELKELQSKTIASKTEAIKQLNRIKFPEVKVLQLLTEKIDQFDKLKNIKILSEKVSVSLGKVRGQLKAFCLPTVNIDALNSKIDRLYTLKNTYQSLDSNNCNVITTKDKIRDIKISLNDKIKDYKLLLKEAKVCPICQGEVTDNCLKEIRL